MHWKCSLFLALAELSVFEFLELISAVNISNILNQAIRIQVSVLQWEHVCVLKKHVTCMTYS